MLRHVESLYLGPWVAGRAHRRLLLHPILASPGRLLFHRLAIGRRRSVLETALQGAIAHLLVAVEHGRFYCRPCVNLACHTLVIVHLPRPLSVITARSLLLLHGDEVPLDARRVHHVVLVAVAAVWVA